MTSLEYRKPEDLMRTIVCTSHAMLLAHKYQLWTCQLAKKHFLENGDIVLLLENADDPLLCKIRKRCKSSNFWGIVIQVVAMKEGMQAIDVKLFADFSLVATYNKNVLPVASIHHYDDQISMLKDCVKWHAHCECTIQLKKEEETAGKVKKVLLASRNAFSALANALSVSNKGLDQVAEMGYQSYHQMEKGGQMEKFIAPAFAYIDTRPFDTKSPSQVEAIDSVPCVPSIKSTKSPESPNNAESVNLCDLEACVLNFFKNEDMKIASSSMRSFLVRGLYVSQPLQNILLIQEKRATQVFLQKSAIECAHKLSFSLIGISHLQDPRKWKRLERRIAYFRVDLLACAGFKGLLSTIFNQLEVCMGKQYNLSENFPIYYCSTDGKRHTLQWVDKHEMSWNIFCANVCHMSVHVL